MQRAAFAAIQTGDEFLVSAREGYQNARDLAASLVKAPFVKPSGATYLWVDLTSYVDPEDYCAFSLLGRMADVGMLLAPGGAFGQTFGTWARLCFTAVGEEGLREGIKRFNQVLEQAESH